MENLSKKQKEYFKKLREAIGSGDEDMYSDLVRQKNPLAIRHDLSTALGEHVAENYDDPLNIFQKKELIKEIPVNYTENLPKGIAGKYIKEHGVFVPKGEETFKKLGTKLHELGHGNDSLDLPESVSDEFNKSSLKKLGAEAADEAFKGHHKKGFFEKYALENLMNNKKLASIMPLIKGAGIGALGLTAAGIGNKAMAGDFKGAASDTGELAYELATPPVLSAVSPTMMGESELPPEEIEKKRKFNLLRKKLGE